MEIQTAVDYGHISQQALFYLDRDGFQKGDLGQPYSGYSGYGRPGYGRPTAHCVGGLVNMALSGGTATEWRSDNEAIAVYSKLAAFMQARWPGYEGLYPYSGGHNENSGTIATINNNMQFTAEDAREALASLAR